MAASMREPTFWILTALASEARHGYGVIREAAALSDGRVNLQPGTLYAALDRLADEGLIEVDREEIVDGRTRRYYRLTDSGASALQAETERLRASAEAAAAQLKRFRPGTAFSRTAFSRAFRTDSSRSAASLGNGRYSW